MIGGRRRERIVQLTPCTGWVARYPVDSVDTLGRKTRAVAAWAVLEEAGGGWRVVGLTSDYERTSDYVCRGAISGQKLARPPAPRLVRCDELPGFVGYDEAGRW
jgi:hypothetical protein